MPKTCRPPDEIERVKDRIADTACAILSREGFERLSMRRLARGLNMTAANIYQYFENKDALYLAIQKRGFERLGAHLAEAAGTQTEPVARMTAIARAYVDFGLTEPDHYEVMLNRHGPKYADYASTPLEPLARQEKDAALAVLDHVAQTAEAVGRSLGLGPDQIHALLFQAWFMLHGFVTLYNTRTVQEVEPDPTALVDHLIRHFLDPERLGLPQ